MTKIEKLICPSSQMKSAIIFFFLVPLWPFITFCFSYSQSILSLVALKLVFNSFWPFILANSLVVMLIFLLWRFAPYLSLIFSFFAAYYSSVFLLSSLNKFYLIFTLIFLYVALLNALIILKELNRPAFNSNRINRGFKGKILHEIKIKLLDSNNTFFGLLLDWDQTSVRVLVDDPNNILNHSYVKKHPYFNLEFKFKNENIISRFRVSTYSEGIEVQSDERLPNLKLIREFGLYLDKEYEENNYDNFYQLSQKLGFISKQLY